jgi:hypothetical protein
MFIVEERSIGAVLGAIAVVVLLGFFFNALPATPREPPPVIQAAQGTPRSNSSDFDKFTHLILTKGRTHCVSQI